jgi:DNA polymerase-1
MNCPICKGAFRFEIKTERAEEKWRCHRCTKGQWRHSEDFEKLIIAEPTVFRTEVSERTMPSATESTSQETLAMTPNYITNDETMLDALAELEKSSVWYFDIETYSHHLPLNILDKPATDPFRNKIRLITVGTDSTAYTFDITKINDPSPIIIAIPEHYIVGHNLKFDLKTIAYKFGNSVLPAKVFDTMLAAILIYHAENAGGIKRNDSVVGLKAALENHLGIVISKEEQASDWGAVELRPEQVTYALRDVEYLSRLAVTLIHRLNSFTENGALSVPEDELGLVYFIAHLENACVVPLVKAELSGIPMNEAVFGDIEAIQARTEELEKWFVESYGLKPTQVQKIKKMLQKEYHLEIEDTSKETLLPHIGVIPVHDLLDYRELVHQAAFLRRMKTLIVESKLYTNFTQIAAPSGRMSTRPSVQNIPRNLKKIIYKVPDDWVIVRGDFPGVELRLAAEKANEPLLIEAFRKKIDLHKLTASKILGKPIEAITDDERTAAKAPNFGALYGIGKESFQKYAYKQCKVKMTVKQARDVLDKFYAAYPTLRAWQKRTGQTLNGRGGSDIISTIYGRRVKVDKYNLALNVPIQGSGADLIKIAFVNLDKALTQSGLEARIINIIHDEIIVMAKREHKDVVAAMLKKAMEDAANKMMPRFVTEVDVSVTE